MKTLYQKAKEFAIEHGAIDVLFIGTVEGCPVYEAVTNRQRGKVGGISIIAFDKDKNPVIVNKDDALAVYSMAVRSQSR